MAAVLVALDYVVMVAMLAISTGIGVFFAVRAGRGQTSNDYFLGNQDVPVIAVVLSISATIMSTVTYLGVPAEVYMYGPKYGLTALARIHAPIIVSLFFVPVYYRLGVVTMYQYIGMRFNNTVRYLVLVVNLLTGFIYMGIVIYTPALALSLAAGFSLEFSILSVGIVCTFYTSVGGLKAVIWTDVFQACAMLIGAVVMVVAGTFNIGGPAEGWSRAVEGGRGELVDFNVDLTVRFTIWSGAIGTSFIWVSHGASRQEVIQRFNACRTERDARLAAWLGLTGTAVIDLLAVAVGMTLFAYYYDCDPVTSGRVNSPDQLVPLFIMDMFYSYPGIPGMLIGCVFCAALSSISSVLNGLVAGIGQDIIKQIWPDLTDNKYTVVVKFLSFLIGLLAIGLAYLASVLGTLIQTVLSLGGIASGPVLGVLILGMFFPRANSKGAVCGMIGAFTVGVIQYVGSQIYSVSGQSLPLSVDRCPADSTSTGSGDMYMAASSVTTPFTPPPTNSEGIAFFHISYLYILALTSTSCVLIGIIVSYITSWKNPKWAEPKFMTPLVARLYANETNESSDETEDVHHLKQTKI